MSLRVCFYGQQGETYDTRARRIASARAEWSATSTLRPEHYLNFDVVCFVSRLERRKIQLLRGLRKLVVLDICHLPVERLTELPVNGIIFPSAELRDQLSDLAPLSVLLPLWTEDSLEDVAESYDAFFSDLCVKALH